jgi:hypothetical protein
MPRVVRVRLREPRLYSRFDSHGLPGSGEPDPLRRDATLAVEHVRPAAESADSGHPFPELN